MEVIIFNAFRDESPWMKNRYLDLENINHLIQQSKGGGNYRHRSWRESYYFNMTDPNHEISLITTIGLLPNKKRSVGFLLIIRKGKPVFLKPLVSLKKPVFSGYEFKIGEMRYTIEGINWRIRYDKDKVNLDLSFIPINRIYPYRKGDEEEWIFDRIGTQHYEQFGMFSGTLNLNREEYDIGPCFGHRDHSWGIRDWGSLDRYSLHCCAFSKSLAFNLWEGTIQGRSFFKGFLFDGEDNHDIIEHNINTDHKPNGREPVRSEISFIVSRNRKFEVHCNSDVSVPFPPPGSLVYEGIGRMRCNGYEGFGLQEYLWHYPNKFRRIPYFLRLLNIIGWR
jgi:hypothetical protein